MQKTGKFKYKKRFGQNFLHDTVKLSKMAAIIAAARVNNIIEIGPGRGALTKFLLEKSLKVTAIEVDKEAVEKLKEEYGSNSNLEIINEDFLGFDISSNIQHPTFNIVGNLPYYITTPIIEKLIQNREHISEAYLTVQKEVAERITAGEGSKTYGSLSVFVQFYSDAEYLFKIGKKAFFPVPKVDSAFIRIKFRKNKVKVKSEELFFRLVRGGFNQRRKTFVNNIKRVFKISHEEALSLVNKAKISPKARAEALSILDFAKLSDLLYNMLEK